MIKNRYFIVGDGGCKIKLKVEPETYYASVAVGGIWWYDIKLDGYVAKVPKAVYEREFKKIINNIKK